VRTRTRTRIPDLTFREELTVHLGDSTVHLRYHGPNNGRGSVSMKFMPADVMFVVDWIVLGRMPYKDLKGYDIQGMIDSTREVLDTDFTTFVGGHGRTGNREDVARYLRYLETLYARVVEGRRSGMSLKELQGSIRLEEFSDLDRYEEWLPLNIAGVSRMLDDRSYLDMQLGK
jgi:glyoxylase-like metal-dependent hydrolase (beta-lactamase superfamily II)